MLYYICNACGRKPIKSKPRWIEHYNTKKHKEIRTTQHISV